MGFAVTGPILAVPTARTTVASPHADRRAETVRVFKLMKGLAPGDPERERLRHAVIEDHMSYARHTAARYGGRGDLVEDFAQVAYLGLVKAADNFDPDYGTGFLGYATPMIVGEIKRYFRDATWDVHVPRRMQELTGALRKATETLTQDLGHPPTLAELARELHEDPAQITEALRATEAYTTASLDHPVHTDGENTTLADFLGREEPRFDATVNREALKPLLAKLADRDKKLLTLRFFEGMTQAEIGEQLFISQMQVSRLLARILDELRAGLG
jgi:RNA polymerase sigma-B factor